MAVKSRWFVIAIGYAMSALFLTGAAAIYVFGVYDLQVTCRRATDLCEVVAVKPFWRKVTDSFRPSQVRNARIETQKRRPCLLLAMKDESPELKLCVRDGQQFAPQFNAFIADTRQGRLDYTAEAGIAEYVFVAMIAFFSLITFSGVTWDVIRRLR